MLRIIFLLSFRTAPARSCLGLVLLLGLGIHLRPQLAQFSAHFTQRQWVEKKNIEKCGRHESRVRGGPPKQQQSYSGFCIQVHFSTTRAGHGYQMLAEHQTQQSPHVLLTKATLKPLPWRSSRDKRLKSSSSSRLSDERSVASSLSSFAEVSLCVGSSLDVHQ